MNLNGMPQAEMPDTKVQANSFYPELSIKELSDNYAVATEYGNNTTMVISKLTDAAFFVNGELATHHALNWSIAEKLAHVSSVEIDGNNRLVTYYKKAVYSLAKSNLLISKLNEKHRDLKAAQQESANDNQEYWKAESFSAIRELQGISKSLSVELI
jgi:hypothetical protein